MTPNVIRLKAPSPSYIAQRQAPGLRSSSTINPTIAAYTRANPAGLFAIASARVKSVRAQSAQLRSKAQPNQPAQPLNLPLTLATTAALLTLVPVALRQLRVIRTLPDPNHHLFNSNRVVTSHKSKPFGIPDSLLGLGSYTATLALVLLAPKSPTAQKLVGPKLALDTTVAAANTVRQFTSFRKVCSWCLLTVAATAAMAITGRKHLRNLA